MKTKDLTEFFENNDFTVHRVNDNSVELETWTNGGVNMIIYLKPFTLEEFKRYVEDFDVDGLIELHRQGREYRNAFSIRESLNDFENFHNWLKSLLL